MYEHDDGRSIHIRLMNDYSAGMPLWDREGNTDGDELGLSDELRADLYAFAERWDAAIPPAAYDDRYDDKPVRRTLVAWRRALRRRLRPADTRAAVAEDLAIDRQGEELRARLQAELGDGYVVTYKP